MTTNTKHTPGPWYAKDGHVFSSAGFDAVQALATSDHNSHPMVADCNKSNMTIAEADANAALIAAAPELLAALKEMVKVCEEEEMAMGDGNAYPNAVAVIEKAEGR